MKFLIDFINTASEEQIQEYLAAANATVITTYSLFDKTFLVEAASEPVKNELIEYVINDEASPIQLQEVRPLEFATEGDNDWWKVASFQGVDFEKSTQTFNRLGAHATVYIMDSGVNGAHQEFVNANVSNLYSFTGDFTDTNGHGTAIASIISGETCGVTAAKIKAVKIFQSGTPTLQSHLLAAFDAIASDIIPGEVNIVNMSWNMPKNSFIEVKIRALINSGVFAVALAGNTGISIEDVTPACMPEVITVGAYNQDLVPCDFSNYTGDLSTSNGLTNMGELDCWAPGEKIRVAKDAAYGVVAGTSFACAIQAAAIAFSSSKLVLTDNTILPFIDKDILSSYSTNSKGFLTLEGRYVNSLNVCTKFGTFNTSNVNGEPRFNHINFIGESGQHFNKLVADISQYSSVSFKDTPPTNVGPRLNNGWIIGEVQTDVPFYWTGFVVFISLNSTVFEIPINVAIYPVGGQVQDLNAVAEITLNPTNTCDPYQTGPNAWICNDYGLACQLQSETCYDCVGNAEAVKSAAELFCRCTQGGQYIAC